MFAPSGCDYGFSLEDAKSIATLTPGSGFVEAAFDATAGNYGMAAVAVAGEVSGGKYLKAAAQLIKNSRFGRAFEKAVLQKLGLSKNAEKVAGAEGKSIPDARTDTQDIEVKGGDYVTDSKQMRIQREAAQAEGKEHVVVVKPGADVSKTVRENSTVVTCSVDVDGKTICS